ncbi:neuregulin 2a isoform X3 [Oncorhynchus mykiss]|uniref:neuregulin 2a isoform X3 n=1 Tax=Oncorhynchus mykiss TaxID=8022 RepID=UPI001877C407|nr:neuregulin 2a isoform X3 [Oncorhynchus mykiss]
MDLDVCVHPFPVLRSEEGTEGGTRLGCPTLRGPPRRGCRWGFGAVRGLLLLLPTLLLLILGLGACLLLLRWALAQGSTSTRSKSPGQLDLRGGEEEESYPLTYTTATPNRAGTANGATGVFESRALQRTSLSAAGSLLQPTPGLIVPTLLPTQPALLPASASTPPLLLLLLITTTPSPGSGHARRCNDSEKAYCVNGGDCYFIHGINQFSCKCPNDFTGDRCQNYVMASFYQHLGIEFMEAEELYQKRVLTITGICVALLVVGIVCVVAYCKTKRQRKKMHNHLQQNMCADHPNRNLANGPNHPGPGPEEIPMVDYISKNVPATERVIGHVPEDSFPGSHASSRSHNSSTHAHSSTHRHEERTWSLERTDSVLSDSPGMMSSSVGTSRCNSPACMEARARRAAHCGSTVPHRPGLQYEDSFDSLGDSPHSDRYVSALTTPARLSPVDFFYSLSPQVPSFQITSPNTSQAMSLPPAAHTPYPPEDDQPLLRRYQVPLHDVQRQEPYRQQRRTYLNDSTGSLPSSPYRLAEEEDYETTQEYLSSREQPKKSGTGSGGVGGRRLRRSRQNGYVAPRGYEASRDYGSRSCLMDSESEGEGESTPFLSMQNMNAEPSTICRPANSRTSQSHSSGRHGARGTVQTRQTHSRSKPDNVPH